MINHWWVTRPKRSLAPVPEILGLVTCDFLDKQWKGIHGSHLSFEDELEQKGLKRKGDRWDQGGGGGRTYLAWLQSLGLVFYYGAERVLKPTMAGEALLNGKSPTDVLTRQVLKYQFPSPFSMSRNVEVSPRFKIRPFRFLLKLLLDSRIEMLSEEEIAKIVVVEAENESTACYEHVVARILEFREKGDACLPADFETRYASNRKSNSVVAKLKAVANTMANWLAYTQFVYRTSGSMMIPPDRIDAVKEALGGDTGLIKGPENHEKFQRQFGLDPWHQKDMRNLAGSTNVTAYQIGVLKVQQELLKIAAIEPVQFITPAIVDSVSQSTGYEKTFVEDVLYKIYPAGALDAFYSAYSQMAINGQEDCLAFEKATCKLFDSVFGFKTEHVGKIGKSPDVLLLSDESGYQAIIDNKAYHQYSITNDHRNRMCVNYLGDLAHYSKSGYQLAFFSYIAGGFVPKTSAQILDIVEESGVHGSAITANSLITLCKMQPAKQYSHGDLRKLFSVDRRINITDFEELFR